MSRLSAIFHVWQEGFSLSELTTELVGEGGPQRPQPSGTSQSHQPYCKVRERFGSGMVVARDVVVGEGEVVKVSFGDCWRSHSSFARFLGSISLRDGGGQEGVNI
jgi:hypothetical protein